MRIIILVLILFLCTSAKNDVWFSPDQGKEIKQELIEAINNSQHSIHLLIFSLTDIDIAQALINAHVRGVDVVIVGESKEWYAAPALSCPIAVHMLIVNQMPAYVMQSNGYMHDKIMIIDNNILYTGSFNYTNNAEKNNQENLLELTKDTPDHINIINKYISQFDIVLNRAKIKGVSIDKLNIKNYGKKKIKKH